MTNHTQEPWIVIENDRIISRNDQLNATYCFGPDDDANARRIVACVNACAGISTESLEKFTIKDLSELGSLASERDALKAANAIVTDNTKTLAAALERNAELEAKLSEMEKQEPIYFWREIGESDWLQTNTQWYEHCQKSPEHDTKLLYALPVPQQSEWIRVSDKRPPTNEPIVYSYKKPDGRYGVGIAYWSVSEAWVPEAESRQYMDGFTRWLPLPPITK